MENNITPIESKIQTVEEKKQKNFFATSLKEDIAIKVREFAKANNTNTCNAVRMLIVKGLSQ